MDVEIVEGRDPPLLRVRMQPGNPADTPKPDTRLLRDTLVGQGYPEWVRDCSRVNPDGAHAGFVVFELACKHEGTVSATRSVGAHGAYVECTRCACRIYDGADDRWVSPPRHGWQR